MTDLSIGSIRRRLAVVFCAIVVAGIHQSAGADELATVRSIVEGTWVLEEWNVEGASLHPPQADGRFSLHDGVVMYFQRYRSQDTTVSLYGYGTYAFGESSWSYHYDYFTTLIEDSQGTKASKDAPWPGIREFKFTTDQNNLILDDAKDHVQFVFEKDHFSFVEGGKVLRKWRKVI